jgi:glycosyltransferase involved in cell wall biosynthesis
LRAEDALDFFFPAQGILMGLNAPMFSVVVPTYNRAGIVMDAVNSVLAQTFTDFEVIVVDDRSTDETQAVLSQNRDPRVAVVVNHRSKGPAGARNAGIFLARGAWICQIDSDDLWPSDMLERFAVAIAEAPADVGIVYGSTAYLDTRTGRVERIRKAEKAGHVHKQLLEDHWMNHCSAALSASALRDVGGYDEAFQLQEDSDLLLRLTERWAVFPVPDAVYVVRMGDGDRLMLRSHEGRIAQEQLFSKHSGELASLPKARYQQLANILSLAAWDDDWSRVARVWLKLVPSIWKAPRVFLRANQFLWSLAVGKTKGTMWRLRGTLGRHIKRQPRI